MTKYVVVGAGPVGRETARLLAGQGDEVRIVSRSGTAAPHDRVEAVRLDARDGEALARVAEGATTLFMCAMAPYDRWPAEFPPIMDGVIAAAERTGARLVIVGNLYGYGGNAPPRLTPDLPLAPSSIKGRVRTAMWERALSSSVPAIEVRGSEYLGAGAGSYFTLAVLPKILAGEPAPVIGDPDIPHPWSWTRDVARTLVVAARYQGVWNRAFHVPSQTATVREVAGRFAASADAPSPDLRPLSLDAIRALAESDWLMREIEEIAYLQLEAGGLDWSETAELLGVTPGSLDEIVADTLRGRDGTP